MDMKFSLNDPAQRRRALMIPVLGGGLIWALFFSGDEEKMLPPAPANAPQQASAAEAAPPRVKEWTEMPLEQILAFNPFPIPRAVPKTAPNVVREAETLRAMANTQQEEVAAQIQQWEAQTVSMIYQGPKGPLAVIGGETFGVGDLLDENTRVTAIRDDGVWVSDAQSEPDPATNPGKPQGQPATLMNQLKNLGNVFGF